MEALGVNATFWQGKKVLITGHNGFKGTWLSAWLQAWGSDVAGYALPPASPSLFELCGMDKHMKSIEGDIRDLSALQRVVADHTPDIVVHMAAQPLVRFSYLDPLATYTTNVMGTAHVLEAVRSSESVRVVLIVTTDKCYENQEWAWSYREIDPLGGYDPYSSSKACAELVTSAYRRSYFHPDHYAEHGVALATVRAGNVIGAGDWSPDRLIPDCIKALQRSEPIVLRHPRAVRPWQHVLEPLSGYMQVIERCYGDPAYGSAWNFGPDVQDALPVEEIVQQLCLLWGPQARYTVESDRKWHEAQLLQLDCAKARQQLGWRPRWRLDEALKKTVEGYRKMMDGYEALSCLQKQIEAYTV